MKLTSINPITGRISFEVFCWTEGQLQDVVDSVTTGSPSWSQLSLDERIRPIRACAKLLKDNRDDYARLITTEMGKVISESYAEIDKCIYCCDFYATNALNFLADEDIDGDATRSFVAYQPLGTLLGIMPWNFPFWQVFRFAVPALITGNSILLKHASHVPQAAIAVEKLMHNAGVPGDVFRSLMITSAQLKPIFSNPLVHGIAFTGSEASGKIVAQLAGANLKKVVLELGGSDAFIVLHDADLESSVRTAVASRFFTSGQSCINAKRIILERSIAQEFMALFTDAVESIASGDPMNEKTRIGPMARADLRENLHKQVMQSVKMGAVPLVGCHPIGGDGYYYQPSILDHVKKGMPAYDEELFGPVAAIIYADDAQDAVRIANDTKYGLGGSVWTQNSRLGEQIARQIESGTVYVNGLIKSDPRLPFGGIKNSGMGRELGRHGMLEFANAKTICIA